MHLLKRVIKAIVGFATMIYIAGADSAMDLLGIAWFLVIGIALLGATYFLLCERG